MTVEGLPGTLDEADPDASQITETLDGITGAWERAQESIEQAWRGETVPLDKRYCIYGSELRKGAQGGASR